MANGEVHTKIVRSEILSTAPLTVIAEWHVFVEDRFGVDRPIKTGRTKLQPGWTNATTFVTMKNDVKAAVNADVDLPPSDSVTY